MNTKYQVLFIGIVLMLAILAAALKDNFSVNIGSKNSIVSPTLNTGSGLETKESNVGLVTVVVTPLNLKDNSSTWNFEIELDTHSEELDADLVAVSELIDDQGKSFKPISWEGASPGGHHREGVLKFNPISPQPKSIELKIKNVGGAGERRFKWIF